MFLLLHPRPAKDSKKPIYQQTRLLFLKKIRDKKSLLPPTMPVKADKRITAAGWRKSAGIGSENGGLGKETYIAHLKHT